MTPTKLAHTPGPWTVDPATTGRGACLIRQATSGRTDSNVIAFDVLPHNAPLIAAAPAMLEALRALVDSFARLLPALIPGECRDALDKANSVLHQAEGEK